MRRMGPPWRPPVSSAAAATRSIPKPPIGRIRSARLITARVYCGCGLAIMVAYSCSFSTQARALPRLIEAKIILGYDPPGLLNSLTRRNNSTPAPPTRHPRRAIPLKAP